MDISNVISALWIITIDHVCHLVGCFKEMFTGFSSLKQEKIHKQAVRFCSSESSYRLQF